jgi:hypothetical protein
MKGFLILAYLFLVFFSFGAIMASTKPPPIWTALPATVVTIAGLLSGLLLTGWLKGWKQ